ncbi:hypothetical protein D3C74_203890 [compost metagenome]
MKKLISVKLSGNILVSCLILLFIFHILLLVGMMPHDIVWGGKISNPESLIIFESISLLLTLLFILVISIKIGYIKKFRKISNFGVWFIFAYFLLNTIANFASDVSAEKLIFGPITVIVTFLTLRLAIEK